MKRLIKIIGTVFSDFIKFFIIYFPGSTGRRLRYYYWRGKFKKCGKNVFIDEGVIIQNPECISIGDNVWIDKYCILMAGKANLSERIHKRKVNEDFIGEEGDLIIGKNVHISPFCIIQAHGGFQIDDNSGFSSGVKVYTLSNLPYNPENPSDIVYFTPMADKSAYFISPVVIKENVGVALNCIILSGVTIGEKSFVAPNSVVLTNVSPNSYVSGNPAKKIKDRFKMEENNE